MKKCFFNSSNSQNFLDDAITPQQFMEHVQCNKMYYNFSDTKTHKSGAKVMYFTCGNYGGLVAEKLAQKIMRKERGENVTFGPILIQNVRGEDGKVRTIMFERDKYSE